MWPQLEADRSVWVNGRPIWHLEYPDAAALTDEFWQTKLLGTIRAIDALAPVVVVAFTAGCCLGGGVEIIVSRGGGIVVVEAIDALGECFVVEAVLAGLLVALDMSAGVGAEVLAVFARIGKDVVEEGGQCVVLVLLWILSLIHLCAFNAFAWCKCVSEQLLLLDTFETKQTKLNQRYYELERESGRERERERLEM